MEPVWYDHKHTRVIVDASIDFSKPSMACCTEDNCKKIVLAITVLLQNLQVVDENAIIVHKDCSVHRFLGKNGMPVPDN